MAILIRALLAGVVALASLGAITQQVRDQGVTDTEIRIGNVMPYSGALEIFGQIGKAEAAYFEMINERGGINGRKIRFMSYDDLSDPSNAMDLTRILVETDNVLLMFGSFGTPGNLAVRKYLNERKIPQLFVASGDHELSEPSRYPWTMGWQPSYREEGRIYANYIQAFYPGKKIVALWENDQFGRELFKGLVQGLGDVAHNIRVDIAYDVDDQHLDGHVSILKQSGAEVFVFAGVPENAAKVIRAAADHGWRPVFVVNQMASSIETVLKRAGTENATGVITAAFLKDASDPAWRAEQGAWYSFLDKYTKAGGKDDAAAVYGYAAAETMVEVLRQCGNDLSRENVMKQAAALRDYQASALLPGIKINTAQFRPVEQLRLLQFDGRSWQPIGDVLDTAFAGSAGK
ncbi:branched-chain amino acid transport system substrate-binding protein [Bradyrhizobium sp. USDA 4524]|uniref:ABC transporter substrate-binding protein n=1 Tax=Bradyrhizobium TaxID=374 RepID=UPI00209D3EAD|nr:MULTISPECIES: ABC transporter substrate-binding protein [Bradyrhizobium]MCP1844052.1 branched-chain amino acid transport system substrate-binding protein [Bradyrhizobium sp. USDA 4538]MCP1904618.1 branched-chain amino acid transport system substrate-binding protein [Bradyrhizobium sp. USDA 4537]MCP1989726.1 branched-chain amino acid transport system substrate-binding protein [Bradyrhizobium sp. USDA 4539]MCP3417397.1 ABC transporter substrate-binding protein [Bradyrhizobium brasilense]